MSELEFKCMEICLIPIFFFKKYILSTYFVPDSILERMMSARPGPHLHEAYSQRLDVRKTGKVKATGTW